MDYTADRNQVVTAKPPLFRNIHVRDVTGAGAPAAIRLTGLDDSLIQDITFEQMTIASTKAVIATHVKNLTFTDVVITPQSGPVFDLTDARDITIRGGKAPAGTEVYLKLEGAGSGGVRIEASDLSAAKQPFAVGKDVPPGAVTVK
jgi:hypothetical protein